MIKRPHAASSPIHLCFLNWIGSSKSRLQIQIEPRDCRRRFLEFGFKGITPALKALLDDENLLVSVDRRGECWDLIYASEISVRRHDGMYECGECTPDQRTRYDTPEALWIDHLFEPFLQWINEELSQAASLALYGSDGFRDARLVPQDGFSRDMLMGMIQLRQHGSSP